MDKDAIERSKREAVARYGRWTAHNLQLQDDVYTVAPGVTGNNESRLRRVVQLVSSLSSKPLAELRALDLGALEGQFAVEFARRGATVVAIEARRANLEKIRVAKEALSLDKLELRGEDVRELSPATHGQFDVMLCLGLLYHLDAADVFGLLERMYEMCDDLMIVDTHVTPSPQLYYEHRGTRYRGALAPEPTPDSDPLSRDVLWSSVGNRASFMLTRASLVNGLVDVGFSCVLECHMPPLREVRSDRATFVALKRPRETVLSVPALDAEPWERFPEPPVPTVFRMRRAPAYRLLRALTPRRVRRPVGRLLTRFEEFRYRSR